MDDKTLNNIHKRLTEKIKKYIHIIRKEYEDYIPLGVLKRLDSIEDYEKLLKILIMVKLMLMLIIRV